MSSARTRTAGVSPTALGKLRPRIVPVILAAGRAAALAMPQALAEFGSRTALEIAVANCRAARNAGGQRMLKAPIVVLGWRAGEVRSELWRLRASLRRGLRIVVNRRWRAGQMSSLRAALRRIPRGAAALLYPVDYALITPRTLAALVRALHGKRDGIIVPAYRGRTGHPVLFSAVLRRELLAARTAREVVEQDPTRIVRVPVRTPAIWQDFDTPAEYIHCRRACRASHPTLERGMNRVHP